MLYHCRRKAYLHKFTGKPFHTQKSLPQKLIDLLPVVLHPFYVQMGFKDEAL